VYRGTVPEGFQVPSQAREFAVTVSAYGDSGASYGTGTVLNDHYIATNAHVVQAASELEVGFAGATVAAEVVRTDSQADLAIVRVDTPLELHGYTLRPATAGIGEQVMLFGAANHAAETAVGVLRATDATVAAGPTGRSSEIDLVGLLQVSVEVKRGDSGGPFVSKDGHVIGIVESADRQEPNLAYGIPIARALTLLALAT
jgi:S1-C subfamily serine protease